MQFVDEVNKGLPSPITKEEYIGQMKMYFPHLKRWRKEYCLSLGVVEEKLPFAKMPGGDTVLAFYVNGHTFCYCDIDDFRIVIVKCQPERIPELMETAKGICQPDSHFNPKYWIGLEVQIIETEQLSMAI